MIHQHHREIIITQKIIDFSIFCFSWIVAYFIRFETFFDLEHQWYFKYIVFIAFFNYYFFKRNGLYGSQRLSSYFDEATSLLKACFGSLSFTILFLYLVSPYKVSRLFLVYYALILIFTNLVFRIIVRKILFTLRAKGRNLKHALIIGDNEYLKHLIEVIELRPILGISFKGFYDSTLIPNEGSKKLGSFHDLMKKEKLDVDYLIIGYRSADYEKTDEIVKKYSGELIEIFIVPDLHSSYLGNEITNIFGNTVISINNRTMDLNEVALKRIADFFLSLIGLILISPLLFIIALLVKMTSKGPIFYGQRRVGLDGKIFTMWKFRSMKVADKGIEPGWTTANDPRKTKFGSFLRKSSLDELPQLWNVLKGDMSLVGPRPEQPFFVEKFKSEIPAYMLRHKVKAGITGWAQINGWRGDTNIKSRIECDIWYIKNWSIYLDFKILFQTVWKGLFSKNAY